MVEINNSTVGNNRIGEKLSSKINVQDLISKIQVGNFAKNKRTCTIIRDLRVDDNRQIETELQEAVINAVCDMSDYVKERKNPVHRNDLYSLHFKC